jgi:hypothetical protein
MVRNLSFSMRKAAALAAVSIIAVSLLVGAIYLLIPSDSPISGRAVVAFALGTEPEVLERATALSGIASPAMNIGVVLTIKFLNGSSEKIWTFGPDYYNGPTNLSIPTCTGQLNSTDIAGIRVDPLFALHIGGGGPITVVLTTADYAIGSDLAGDAIEDLGVINVTHQRHGGVAGIGSQSPFFGRQYLNYSAASDWTNTGYWNDYRGFPKEDTPPSWGIYDTQIQNILLSASDPAKIIFEMDLKINVDYKTMTYDGNVTSSLNGTAQWSGTWGTLQLIHDGEDLIGLTYNFPNIYLDAILT